MYLQVFCMEINFISQLSAWVFITILLMEIMNFTELPRLFADCSSKSYHQLKWLIETNWAPYKGWDKRLTVTPGRIISIFSWVTRCRCSTTIQEEGLNLVPLPSNGRKNDRYSLYLFRIKLTGIFSSISTHHLYGTTSLRITTNWLVFSLY